MTPSDRPQRIERSKLLVGEGIEEERFFTALLRHLRITDVQVMQYQGKQKLAAFLQNIPVLPGFDMLQCLGITRDADDDVAAAIQSVDTAIVQARSRWPQHLQVRRFLLPGESEGGMLETLCVRSVENDRAMPCVDELFKCVQERASRKPGNPWKAKAHAFLATLDRPDRRVGEAAEQAIWPFDHDAFKPLVDFIRSL